VRRARGYAGGVACGCGATGLSAGAVAAPAAPSGPLHPHSPCTTLHAAARAAPAAAPGCPGLVADVWDPSLLLTAPLRALLDQCCALFPAFPAPLLRLLSALSAGPRGAGEAYAYLAREPVLTVLHDHVRGRGGGRGRGTEAPERAQEATPAPITGVVERLKPFSCLGPASPPSSSPRLLPRGPRASPASAPTRRAPTSSSAKTSRGRRRPRSRARRCRRCAALYGARGARRPQLQRAASSKSPPPGARSCALLPLVPPRP
jgi:hypothetical protein